MSKSKPQPMSKMPSMKKKATAADKSAKAAKPAAAHKKETPPVPNAKPHTRKAKPAEIDRVERGKRLAAAYLTQRDGLDADTASIVVDSMDPADVEALITEANTSTMEQTPAPAAPSAPAASPEPAPANGAVPEPPEPDMEPIDFLSVPALADDDTFPEIVVRCRDAAVAKNEAEKKYKADKKTLDIVLAEAGIDKLQPLTCAGVKLVRYTGKGPRLLSATKLLNKGVSIDIINQCYDQVTYDDVRITTPEA